MVLRPLSGRRRQSPRSAASPPGGSKAGLFDIVKNRRRLGTSAAPSADACGWQRICGNEAKPACGRSCENEANPGLVHSCENEAKPGGEVVKTKPIWAPAPLVRTNPRCTKVTRAGQTGRSVLEMKLEHRRAVLDRGAHAVGV